MSSMKEQKAPVHAAGKKRVRSMNKIILCKTVAEMTGLRPMDVRVCLEELVLRLLRYVRCFAAHVFGCLECTWEGEEVSVLMMERVPRDTHRYAVAWFH